MVNMTNCKINYTELHTIDEHWAVVELQKAIWGENGFDPVPTHVLHAVAEHGGLLVGAWDDAKLVGFGIAFCARHGHTPLLWSHIAGIHPHYQNQNIGFHLKQFQRNWGLENGHEIIGWTFDPLQRGNANFNLHRLGAISNTYKINIYGEMTDQLNKGLQSDRLAVTWNLNDERVAQLAQGTEPTPILSDYRDDQFLIRFGQQDLILHKELLATEGKHYFVEAPCTINTLKQENMELAKHWQLALRDMFLSAFAAGYWVVDFVKQDNRCWYVLQKSQQD